MYAIDLRSKGITVSEGDGVQSYTAIREFSMHEEIPLVSVCVQGGVGTVATVRDAVMNGTASLLVQVFNADLFGIRQTNGHIKRCCVLTMWHAYRAVGRPLA